MLNQSAADLIFDALGDPTRRALIARLSRGPMSVSELGRPFGITLAAVVQHVQVLERSRLVRTEKVGRVRTCWIEPAGLDVAAAWLAERRALWERRLDRLGDALAEQDAADRAPGRAGLMAGPVVHRTLSVERTYPAPPARVFAAFADPATKRRWFAEGAGVEVDEFTLDFRVGGFERTRFRLVGGAPMRNDTLFLDIVAGERIVFAYALTAGEVRASAALTTVELAADGGGTRLLLTEQVAFLDGADGAASRQRGWGALLDRLGEALPTRPGGVR